MIHPRQLLAALPVATLAVALAACTPPEESPPMDPPANVETAPANDPWTQPETADPAAVDPIDDPWTDPMPPEEPPLTDQPPTPIDPALEPVDEQVPPPEPEEVIDPVDP